MSSIHVDRTGGSTRDLAGVNGTSMGINRRFGWCWKDASGMESGTEMGRGVSSRHLLL